MPRIALEQLQQPASRALARAGASPAMAEATARALVYAEARGLASHGASRVSRYAAHLKNGRADGGARPSLRQRAAARRSSMALLASRSWLVRWPSRRRSAARGTGIAFAGVTNSQH